MFDESWDAQRKHVSYRHRQLSVQFSIYSMSAHFFLL